MKLLKYFLFIFYLFFSIFFLDCEILILNNGNLLIGNLNGINNEKILFKFNEKNYEFNLKSVDLFYPDFLEERNINLSVLTSNRNNYNLILLKLNSSKIYYFSKENFNDVNVITFNNILNISQKNNDSVSKEPISVFNNINFYNIKNFGFLIDFLTKNINSENLLDAIKGKKMENFINLNLEINDINFYENFWNKFEYLINKETKQNLWNLLEQYSDKEKILNFIYSENNTVLNKNLNNIELDLQINNLRKDFYIRVINILLFNELIFKDKINY